ncbi:hypothetical protein ABZ234_06280 [Nocardiopsis sp. NPDC006198]|uniref:hypothetical protein n=1 Tax=Nocardiopsis sp. NPDC006198 TaxID=3154472 RepID=UPI0033AE9331
MALCVEGIGRNRPACRSVPKCLGASGTGGETALRGEVEHLWRLGQLLQRVLDPAFENDPELAEVPSPASNPGGTRSTARWRCT